MDAPMPPFRPNHQYGCFATPSPYPFRPPSSTSALRHQAHKPGYRYALPVLLVLGLLAPGLLSAAQSVAVSSENTAPALHITPEVQNQGQPESDGPADDPADDEPSEPMPSTPETITPPPAPPTTSASAMTAERLGEIIRIVDPEAVHEGNSWQFQFQQRPMYLVYDNAADRMRLMSPIAAADQLDEALMYRMLQANYDAVLDPRYAVARGFVWSVFIHPLAALREEQFASAVVQVYSAADTFGTSFTSGVLIFGGGDSGAEHRRLLEALQELLNPTT